MLVSLPCVGFRVAYMPSPTGLTTCLGHEGDCRLVSTADAPNAPRWRLLLFLRNTRYKMGCGQFLENFSVALNTVKKHQERILKRCVPTSSLEALNGTFKTARARVRGYRNVQTLITMIYMIAAPLGQLFKST